ncbi:MAG: hypothetical protein DYH08_02190 [Actinobacteria bacterium ATB1]|nr:hypothetical protein [Actinobacteria bacterium ATB1]
MEIRHTNLIERTFDETRRRVKVIGRLPGEASCLSLVWGVLDRASRGWRGLTYTPAIARQLTELRQQLHHPTNPAEHTPTAAVTTVAEPDHRSLRPTQLLHQRRDATTALAPLAQLGRPHSPTA